MSAKKKYFRWPEASTILRGRGMVHRDIKALLRSDSNGERHGIIEQLLSLDTGTTVGGILQPPASGSMRFQLPVHGLLRDVSGPRFMRHGPEIVVRTYGSQQEARSHPKTLQSMLRETYQTLHDTGTRNYWIAISSRPFCGDDRRVRRRALIEDLEGAKTFSYGKVTPWAASITDAYVESIKATQEGGAFVASIPSRSKGEQRYKEVRLKSVPVHNNAFAVSTALQFETKGPRSQWKNYQEDRWKTEDARTDSDQVLYTCQDVAAYWAAAEYMASKNELSTYWNSPFLIPSQEFVDAYVRLLWSTVYEQPEITMRIRERPDEIAEEGVECAGVRWGRLLHHYKETLLQNIAVQIGPERAFYFGDDPFTHMAHLRWHPLHELKKLRWSTDEPHDIIKEQIAYLHSL